MQTFSKVMKDLKPSVLRCLMFNVMFVFGFRERGWVALAFALKPQEVLPLGCTACNKPGKLLPHIQLTKKNNESIDEYILYWNCFVISVKWAYIECLLLLVECYSHMTKQHGSSSVPISVQQTPFIHSKDSRGDGVKWLSWRCQSLLQFCSSELCRFFKTPLPCCSVCIARWTLVYVRNGY